MTSSDEARAAFTRAQERILQRKWCPDCQSSQPPEGGRMVSMRNGRAERFRCAACCAKARKTQ